MREMNLVKHWKIVRLEEIADMRGGASFPKAYQGNTEGKYPFYKVSDMNTEGNETLMQASNNWVEEDTVEILRAKLFSKDTVIFPKVGAAVHTNKKRLLSCDSLVDNNVMGVTIRDHGLCIPYYLLYWFESVDLVDFSNPGPLPSITVTTVKNAKIPLPPLPEQRAIAHILQTIQEAKAARQRELALERECKAALMDHLFSYGTKGEPRKQTEIGEIPESWEVVKIGQIADFINGYSQFNSKSYMDNGIPIFRIGDLGGQVDLSGVKRVSKDIVPDLNQKRLFRGDILIAKIGKRVGASSAYNFDEPAILSSQVVGVRARRIDQKFLGCFIKSSLFYDAIKPHFFGSTRDNISPNQIGLTSIPLPSPSEQRAIADVFQAIDEKTIALEQETTRLDELFHAMLDELMTGQRSAAPLIDAELPN